MKKMAWGLGLACSLSLAACGGGGDPLQAANAALAAKDPAKAELLLQGVISKMPELRVAHMRLFVVAQYLAVQGDPARQQAFQTEALDQYDWLVKSYGLHTDYGDMQGSLKADPQAAADLAAARQPLYGD